MLRLLAAAAPFLVASLASSVQASPLVEPHLGGVVLVGPTSAHPSSVFWNPAALAQMGFRGSHLFFSGSGRLDRTSIERSSIDPATGAPGGSQTFDPVTTNALSPGGFFAAVSDLGSERYRFGISLYTPIWETFADGGDALAYHTREGYLRAEYLTGSLAVRATQHFFFGVGFSVVFSQAHLMWDRDRGLEACPAEPCAVEDRALAERIQVDTDEVEWQSPVRSDWFFLRSPFKDFDSGTISLSFNAGLMFRIPKIPNLWFGGAWISFPTFSEGTVLQDGGKSEVLGLEPDGQTGYRLVGDTRVGHRLPQMVHFGVRYEITEVLDLVFALRWIDLSRHGGLDIRLSGMSPESKDVPEVITRWRGLQDIVSLEGGVEHVFNDRLRGGARLRLESSGVAPEDLAPHQVDAPKVDLGVGGEYALLPSLKATFGYSLALLLPQDTGTSAFDPTQAAACRDSGFDLDVCAPSRQGRAVPTAAGSYSRITHELVLGLEYQWF
jgi:long-subunit fatty acid transport protein